MSNDAIIVLSLALLAHAAASRIPVTLGVAYAAATLYVLTLVIVLWCLFHRVLA